MKSDYRMELGLRPGDQKASWPVVVGAFVLLAALGAGFWCHFGLDKSGTQIQAEKSKPAVIAPKSAVAVRAPATVKPTAVVSHAPAAASQAVVHS